MSETQNTKMYLIKSGTLEVLKNYPNIPESLIAILQDVQDKFQYIPEKSIRIISEKLGLTIPHIYSVATFYKAFSLKPKGKYVIQVCMGTACHIKGAPVILEELKNILKVDEGEVTKDGLFSVERVRCLGCCSLAPVLSVKGKVYGNVRPENIEEIIESIKSRLK